MLRSSTAEFADPAAERPRRAPPRLQVTASAVQTCDPFHAFGGLEQHALRNAELERLGRLEVDHEVEAHRRSQVLAVASVNLRYRSSGIGTACLVDKSRKPPVCSAMALVLPCAEISALMIHLTGV
jgi:hypothetical protein